MTTELYLRGTNSDLDNLSLSQAWEVLQKEALVSGHYAIHYNVCCDVEDPCEDARLEDHEFDKETQEWSFHPADGVCCHSVAECGGYTGMNICEYDYFYVFSGVEIESSIIEVDDGAFVNPKKLFAVFDNEKAAIEYILKNGEF